MAGYVLILAVLILGGVIATLGDRIGTRVGKARLSLFNLRPKKTAILVTIITGSIISATTLGILLAASQELRDGIFRLADIKRQQQQVRAELAQAQQQRDQIQQNLSQTRQALASARNRLSQVRDSLNQAIERQQATEARLNQAQSRYLQAQADLKNLRTEISRLDAERQRLIVQRNQSRDRFEQAQARLGEATRELAQREQAVQQLKAQRDQLETQRNQLAAQRDRLEQSVQAAQVRANQAQARLQEAEREQRELLDQQAQLKAEIASLEANQARLERSYIASTIGLRSGNVAIRPGQVLASGVVREINTPALARQVVDQFLREANRVAVQLLKPQSYDPSQQVVQIAKADFQQIAEQINDGQAYAIRLVAALNVVEGENRVLLVPQVVRNQKVFSAGEQVATIALDLSSMEDEQILERLDRLFAQANRQAIEGGILRDPLTGSVGSFSQADLIQFILGLKNYEGTVQVAAVTPEPVYTSGPLSLELVALRDQEVILRSR